MTPQPKRSAAGGGSGAIPLPWAVSPNRRRNRGPAGAKCAAGVRDRSSWGASGSRKTREIVCPCSRSARGTAPSSSLNVRVQSSRISETGTPSATAKVRSRSEKRSPPPRASEPTAAPATTRRSCLARASTRSRWASRCSTVNTTERSALPLVGQELAVEGDPYTCAGVGLAALERDVERDGAHDPVAEVLVDERLERRAVDLEDLVEAVDRRIGGREGVEGPARRDLLQDGHRLVGQAQRLPDARRQLGRQRMLAEQRGGQPDTIGSQSFGEIAEREARGALGVEDLRGDGTAVHGGLHVLSARVSARARRAASEISKTSVAHSPSSRVTSRTAPATMTAIRPAWIAPDSTTTWSVSLLVSRGPRPRLGRLMGCASGFRRPPPTGAKRSRSSGASRRDAEAEGARAWRSYARRSRTACAAGPRCTGCRSARRSRGPRSRSPRSGGPAGRGRGGARSGG